MKLSKDHRHNKKQLFYREYRETEATSFRRPSVKAKSGKMTVETTTKSAIPTRQTKSKTKTTPKKRIMKK
jgi:hypothetical protein